MSTEAHPARRGVKLGFRLKLFLVSVGLITVSFVGADLYLARALDAQLSERIHQDSLVRLSLLERDVSATAASLDDLDSWDALADELGRRARARVSVIRNDGVVIGDSEVDRAALAGVANHRDRPEVRDALAHGSGSDLRMSETTHQRFAYLATPFSHGGAIAGTVRLAVPLTSVDAALGQLHRTILLASAVAYLAAILMSSLAAQWMARLVRSLTGAARRMAGGDLDVRTRIAGHDELAELSGALDQLASSLSEAMTQLRAERDLLSGVFDGMQEGVLVLDRGGDIVRMNTALRRALLLGGDAIGRPLLDVVRNAELKELVDAARVEAVTGEVEISGLKPRRLLVRGAMLPGDEGLLLVVARDVTDVRRLETMRRDFVANVSHELRTPVTSIRSAAETLSGGASTDPVAALKFVDIIARNAERLQRLIEDLLDLSRIESKELKLRPETIDLRAFVNHNLSLFRDRADKRGIQLRADLAVVRALADRRALEQVLSNLVENAVKYCPNAIVTVRAIDRGDRVALVVTDTGPGIAASHLPRLFERFYRVDAGRSRDLGSTGLGLSIVKHLCEAMGGSVDVESAVGRGTTFTVVLPAAARAEQTTSA